MYHKFPLVSGRGVALAKPPLGQARAEEFGASGVDAGSVRGGGRAVVAAMVQCDIGGSSGTTCCGGSGHWHPIVIVISKNVTVTTVSWQFL